MKHLFLSLTIFLTACQSTQAIRCDLQRIQDDLSVVKMHVEGMSKKDIKNVMELRKSVRAMECEVKMLGEDVVCCEGRK